MKRTHTAPYRALVLLAILAIGVLLLLATATAATGSSEPMPTAYVVQSGDTLWSIAEATYDDGMDTRQAIHSIKALNGLGSSSLSIGQSLFLPAS